jgi:hypothetical protein
MVFHYTREAPIRETTTLHKLFKQRTPNMSLNQIRHNSTSTTTGYHIVVLFQYYMSQGSRIILHISKYIHSPFSRCCNAPYSQNGTSPASPRHGHALPSSPTPLRLSDRSHTQKTKLDEPIATRTRSRTTKPSPLQPTPTTSSPPPISSGTVTKKRTTPHTLDLAIRKLRHMRLELKNHLETNNRLRDDNGYLKPSARSKI